MNKILLLIGILIYLITLGLLILHQIRSNNVDVTEINPCPECGSSPNPRCVGDWKTLYIVHCPECGYEPKDVGYSKEEAIKIWNASTKSSTIEDITQ